ncbi:sigma-54-dependent Fis family transcriptional regulator [Corticibacter populi]|uniref:Sigma-54-dependent Fis family transcriptional regulator n=1 Tax=Corticibacter populi TaxID=1550736 RepID=A0A3M6QPH9_9BURK|nr:sigma-54 dependent transcriptional regulator [Corticibacter populi]RMX04963.1 sigma-54-dependent Fis family transcriptional regulator [Corticibacter populi]RZS33610.1 two-component system response regulator PilR (NtrC family) [Corticibacter populi]
MSEKTASILVVDDEPDLRLLYELTLVREGYTVETAESLAQARASLAHRFDVVLLDMRLPDGLGIEILQELQAAGRPERCVVVTAYGSAENAVEALRAGAFDYLSKPVELKQLRSIVASAVQGLSGASAGIPNGLPSIPSSGPPSGVNQTAVPPVPLEQEAATAPATPASAAGGRPATRVEAAAPSPGQPQQHMQPVAMSRAGRVALERMVGRSAAMQAVKERIVKVARSMAPVHIHGESGTGKELVARALHANSQRAEGPLVAVNCGAIPENLLEAEFFGAKKGSYTGATQDREGFFQAARGGTLFLDEIGDLPLAMQTKLLRAIQERCVRPLGSTQEEMVDVRLVSATHRDLAREVAAGRFRQDLFYRLNVIEVRIPPLRERREDLPELTRALLQRLAQDSGMGPLHMEPGFLEAMASRAFPGNVRELENLLHRAVALSENGWLLVASVCDEGESAASVARATPAMAVTPAADVLIPPPAPPSAPVVPAHALPPVDAPVAAVPAAPPAPAPADGETTAVGAAPAAVEALPDDLQAWLDEQERQILIRALKETHYNRTAAASRLGLNLRQIRYRIERLNIPVGPEERG